MGSTWRCWCDAAAPHRARHKWRMQRIHPRRGPRGGRSLISPCGRDLGHPRGFLFRRQPAVRRELVDKAREMLAQPGEQICVIHPGLLRQLVERVGSERAREIALRDRLVRAGADPCTRDVALATLLELLEQTVESAVEHRSGGGTAENSAQCATEQVAEVAALSAWQASTDVTSRGPDRLGGWRAGPAHVFHRVDRK